MATRTNNGPIPNPGEIKSILKFLKDLLPTRVVKAIDILLHPCCDFSILEATAVCDDTGTYTVTLVLDKKISLNGNGVFQIFVGGVNASFAEATIGDKVGTWVDNTSTLVLTEVDILPFTAGDYKLTLALALPTGYGPYTSSALFSPFVGIQSTTDAEITFPSCGV